MVYNISTDFFEEFIVEADSEESARRLFADKIGGNIENIKVIPTGSIIKPVFDFMEDYIELQIK